MLLILPRVAVFGVCLACLGDGRRLKSSVEKFRYNHSDSSADGEINFRVIRQDIDDRKAEVNELVRTAQELSEDGTPASLAGLEAAMAAVEQVEAKAAGLEENLIQDRSYLESLSIRQMSDREEQAREAATADVNVLADKIETAKSQLANLHQKLEGRLQIKRVKRNIDDRTASIQELTSKVTKLSEGKVPSEIAKLQDALSVVEQTRKGAELFEENLAQDKLTLNRMSGLSDEETKACQAAITDTDSLADKVKSAKSGLASFQQRLEGKIKIVQVKQNIDDRKAPISALSQRVSQWSRDEVPSVTLAEVKQAQKGALEFGEYIVQDMIKLDQLSGLSEQERQDRKAAIMSMNALGEEVDSTKSNLADLHRKVQGRIKEVDQRTQREQERAAEAERLRLEAAANEEKMRSEAQARKVREFEEAASGIIKRILDSPAPGKKFWSQIELPMEFHLNERDGVYNIVASMSGLSEDDFEVQPSRDGMFLDVRGICTPNDQQIAIMKQEIGQYLQGVAQKEPHQLARGVDPGRLYAELGNGEFGEFAERIRLPRDADVNRMRLSYDDSVLYIIIPRMTQRRAPSGNPSGWPFW